jgi:hypothetical protein
VFAALIAQGEPVAKTGWSAIDGLPLHECSSACRSFFVGDEAPPPARPEPARPRELEAALSVTDRLQEVRYASKAYPNSAAEFAAEVGEHCGLKIALSDAAKVTGGAGWGNSLQPA